MALLEDSADCLVKVLLAPAAHCPSHGEPVAGKFLLIDTQST